MVAHQVDDAAGEEERRVHRQRDRLVIGVNGELFELVELALLLRLLIRGTYGGLWWCLHAKATHKFLHRYVTAAAQAAALQNETEGKRLAFKNNPLPSTYLHLAMPQFLMA